MVVRAQAVVVFEHDPNVQCRNLGRTWSLYATFNEELVVMPSPGVCISCGSEPVRLTSFESVKTMLRD